MSITITYGKRRNRNILTALGSRPWKNAANASLSIQLPFNPSVDESPNRTSRKRAMADPKTVEEMASWLLDDSTLECLENEGEDSSPKKRRANTPDMSHYHDEPAISPLNLPSPLETPPNPSGTYSQKSRVARLSPRSPGKVPKRAATTRVRKSRSQKRASTNLKRQLSLDPLKFHPTNNLKVSTSVPLSAVDRNARKRVIDGPCTPPTVGDGATGDAISGKLTAMLAATDALKPTPQRTNSSSSRLTRMVPSKVLAKVSNAWDRFHPKASPLERGSQYKSALGAGEAAKLDGLNTTRSPASPDNMSPISNIEIRLNEGDNLNKRKVQRIVGGRVNRKPLADDGKSLRIGKITDDPFCERDGWRTPTTFEHRLKAGSDNEDDGLALLRSPFECEKEFDNNIEDRFLNSTPVGSSTPRIIIEQASASGDEDSSTADSTSPSQRRLGTKLSHPPLRFNQKKSIENNDSKLAVGNSSEKILIDSVSQARQAWERSTRGFTSFGAKRTKKHPSPSKEALEDLERGLQQYAQNRASETDGHDMDKLNADCIGESSSLTHCGRNRSSLTYRTVTNIDELANPLYDGVHHRRGSSASIVEYSSQSKVMVNQGIRLAPPYRPTGSSPHDVDELH